MCIKFHDGILNSSHKINWLTQTQTYPLPRRSVFCSGQVHLCRVIPRETKHFCGHVIPKHFVCILGVKKYTPYFFQLEIVFLKINNLYKRKRSRAINNKLLFLWFFMPYRHIDLNKKEGERHSVLHY